MPMYRVWAYVWAGLESIPTDEVATVLGIPYEEAKRFQMLAKEYLDMMQRGDAVRLEEVRAKLGKGRAKYLKPTDKLSTYHPVEES